MQILIPLAALIAGIAFGSIIFLIRRHSFSLGAKRWGSCLNCSEKDKCRYASKAGTEKDVEEKLFRLCLSLQSAINFGAIIFIRHWFRFFAAYFPPHVPWPLFAILILLVIIALAAETLCAIKPSRFDLPLFIIGIAPWIYVGGLFLRAYYLRLPVIFR